MKARIVVCLRIPSAKRLKTVFRSLKPEINNVPDSRSHAALEKKGGFLILRIEAKDTVALRAAVNAYLRWINSMINVLDVVEAKRSLIPS